MAYIHYDEKPNGAIYASVYESYREAGNVKTRRKENQGWVVDREKGLFRQKGKVYQFTIEGGRNDTPDVFPSEKIVPAEEKLILDFGDSWFLEQYISEHPILQCFQEVLSDQNDSVMALVLYRMLTHKGASCHAKIWYEGNYAYLSYPKANLTSQNISKLLKELVHRKIFNWHKPHWI